MRPQGLRLQQRQGCSRMRAESPQRHFKNPTNGLTYPIRRPEQGSWLQLDILGGHNRGSVRRGIVCALHTW